MRIIRSAAHGPLMRPAPGRPIMPKLQFLAPTVWIVPILLAVAIGCGAQAPVPEPVTDQETELGQEMYKQLKAKGEIVETSPLYDALRPMADSISRVAQTRYPHPFKFFIVHEAQPNAFATPGGNVYVVDSCSTSERTPSNWRERYAMKSPIPSTRTVSSS